MKNLSFIKLIILTGFLNVAAFVNAQYVSIPDSSFRQALLRLGYSSSFDNTHTMLDTTSALVLNADSLDISQADIYDITGIQYFKSLSYLNCFHNPFAFLAPLPDSLTTLICNESLLTSLPSLPITLKYFNCGDNFITTLPSLPDSLLFLSCQTNSLSYLPALPSTLTYLSCYGNQITTLPALPNTLTYLDCGVNLLDSLPALPDSLNILFCGINSLLQIPALPAGLTKFYCNNNQLSIIPALPNYLNRFYCFGNKITTLPALPAGLTWLDCSYNQLTSLPVLPDSLHTLSCGVNTSLYCLPQLNKVVFLSFDSTGVTCLPNYPQNNSSSLPALNTLPICSSGNASGCLSYTGINEVNSDASVKIFPNPVHDILGIELNANEVYIITDLHGRQVLAGSLQQGINAINIAMLIPGVYMLSINGQGNYKLVKQ